MATQQELADHIDLSTRRIRGLVNEGIIPASKGRGGFDLDICRLAYIRYLRGKANGQVKPEAVSDIADDDYTRQLEKERWRKEKRNNDIEEGLVAPVDLLTEALHKVGAQMIPILESLPLNLKRSWPEITGDQITMIQQSIAECRNAIADIEVDLGC